MPLSTIESRVISFELRYPNKYYTVLDFISSCFWWQNSREMLEISKSIVVRNKLHLVGT